jgi:hypothetical protein
MKTVALLLASVFAITAFAAEPVAAPATPAKKEVAQPADTKSQSAEKAEAAKKQPASTRRHKVSRD